MNYILSGIKKEIADHFTASEALAKRVSVAQESYFKDKSNELLFKNWMFCMNELSHNEQTIRHLKAAYKSMCSACGAEEQDIETIVKEREERKAKRAQRKPRASKEQPKKEDK